MSSIVKYYLREASMDKVIADLGRLGFAPLEAKVYLGLLPQGALTGYAIGGSVSAVTRPIPTRRWRL